MNENLDLTIILEGCPEGTKFYSVIYGECSLVEIFDNLCYPISLKAYSDKNKVETRFDVMKDGRFLHYHNGECTLFPSKDQRDWSKFVRFWDKPKKADKFDPKTFQPFDKVLVRDDSDGVWIPTFFRYINPTANIRLAAGRALLTNYGEIAFQSGASASITGNMLTTAACATIRSDRQMLTKLGRDVTPAYRKNL